MSIVCSSLTGVGSFSIENYNAGKSKGTHNNWSLVYREGRESFDESTAVPDSQQSTGAHGPGEC